MADVQAVADRIVVLRLGRNAAEFDVGEVTTEQLVAAITGASDNVVAARAARDRTRPRDHAGGRSTRRDLARRRRRSRTSAPTRTERDA